MTYILEPMSHAEFDLGMNQNKSVVRNYTWSVQKTKNVIMRNFLGPCNKTRKKGENSYTDQYNLNFK